MSKCGAFASLVVLATASPLACRRHAGGRYQITDAASPSPTPLTSTSTLATPVPQRGMAWIDAGPLVVGTPPNIVPRRPDRDLPGEQFVLHGFYIDVFPYPNEEGAIPTTHVTQNEARTLCVKSGKRLCSELEWERACKGPSQHTYEYGEHYREETCGTGMAVVPQPNGFKVGCRSDFGVHDMHGGVFEWTESRWARGSNNASLVTVRGGNDDTGELIARCANAEPRPAEAKSSNTGFRCCLGPVNEVEIVMRVDRGETMTTGAVVDAPMLHRLLERVPPAIAAELKDLKWEGVAGYIWRPLGNERLNAISLCTHRSVPQNCGVLIGRDTPGSPVVLGFAGTGYFPSKLYVDVAPEDVWVVGNDASGAFRRLIHYGWGALTIGPKERNLSRSAAETPLKGRRHRSPKRKSPTGSFAP